MYFSTFIIIALRYFDMFWEHMKHLQCCGYLRYSKSEQKRQLQSELCNERDRERERGERERGEKNSRVDAKNMLVIYAIDHLILKSSSN